MNNKSFFSLDPLWFFLMGALVLFAIDGFFQNRNAPEIIINSELRSVILAQEAALKGSELTPEEEIKSIENYIDNQVLFNEAVRMQLHRDENIQATLIRRYRALLTAALPEPTDNELQDYYQQHPQNFMNPRLYDVEFYSLSSDTRINLPGGDALNTVDDAVLMLGADAILQGFTHHSERELLMRFGKNVSDQVPIASLNQWYGPLRNVRGVFYLRVLAVHDGVPQPYADVSRYVRDAWLRARQDKILNEKLTKLKADYRIHVQEP